MASGGHFNPFGADHGSPKSKATKRHVGDLGNIKAKKNKTTKVKMTDKLVQLSGDHSVVGRAVVVHADEDDLGKGGEDDSKTTGHAGARVACGVIGLVAGQ